MTSNSKTFLITDIFGKNLGEITLFFKEKKFEVRIPFLKEKEKVEALLKQYFKEGISDLGEVILKKPIDITNSLFELALQKKLRGDGFVILPKEGKS